MRGACDFLPGSSCKCGTWTFMVVSKLCVVENCNLDYDRKGIRWNRSSSEISLRDSRGLEQFCFPSWSLLAFGEAFQNVILEGLDLVFLPLMAHHNIDIFQTLELQPLEISVLSKAMDSDLYCKQGTAARFCCSLITARGLSFLSSLLDEQSVTN